MAGHYHQRNDYGGRTLFETQINFYPSHPTAFSSYYYKIINAGDYSITKYSVEHSYALLKGFGEILVLLNGAESKQLQTLLERVTLILQRPFVVEMLQIDSPKKLSPTQVLYFANHLRFHFKQQLFELIDMYNRLDAYLSLAIASKNCNSAFLLLQQVIHLLLMQRHYIICNYVFLLLIMCR